MTVYEEGGPHGTAAPAPLQPPPPRPPLQQDDSDDEDTSAQWKLGYAEAPVRSTDLLRHHFPSKVGGRPAWLDPLDVPSASQLSCPLTGHLMRFLLQVYAPLDKHGTFHRAIFLFISPDGADALLSRERDPFGVHAAEASTSAGAGADSSGAALHHSCDASGLFRELELVVDDEPSDEEDEEAVDVQRALQAYHRQVAAEGELTEEEMPAEQLDQLETVLEPEQRHFASFQARIARAPDQVLRYSFDPDAAPLWPSTSNVPQQGAVPPCDRCGAQRRFEFQVLPQLLHYMDLDVEDPQAPDWGTIAVYSCSASCSPPPSAPAGQPDAPSVAYAEEYVFVQPP